MFSPPHNKNLHFLDQKSVPPHFVFGWLPLPFKLDDEDWRQFLDGEALDGVHLLVALLAVVRVLGFQQLPLRVLGQGVLQVGVVLHVHGDHGTGLLQRSDSNFGSDFMLSTTKLMLSL